MAKFSIVKISYGEVVNCDGNVVYQNVVLRHCMVLTGIATEKKGHVMYWQ